MLHFRLDIILFFYLSLYFFFFLMIRRPPRSTLFPTRRSSDLGGCSARPSQLPLLLRQARRAHSMRGLRLESLLEELFHRDPLAARIQLATPAAHAQELLEIVQSEDQSARQEQDR